MGSRSGAWRIVIGLAVVCGLLVFAGGFLHRRALEKSVLDAQATSELYAKTKLAHAVEGIDLSEQLKDADAASLTKDLDPPTGDGVRIFAPDGTAVFSSEGIESFPADGDALATAKAGTASRVIDGPDLRVYAPILGKGQRVLAVAAVVSNYTQMRKDVSGPLDPLRLPLAGIGVVLLAAGLILMVQATKGQTPLAAAPPLPTGVQPAAPSRVTGFEPVAAASVPAAARFTPPQEASAAEGPPSAEAPKEKRSVFGRRSSKTDEAPAPVPAGASASALDREVAIRQALEDQLEQLRTQMKTQHDERLNTARELTGQLEEATRRAEDAEARLELGGAGAPAERVTALEQELAQARNAVAAATARADELQRMAAAAPDPSAEQRMAELAAQLTDAQQRASSAEQRAASVESVRDELEVRVAQLGTKTGELEQRAVDLEASLQEANAGGDAVRAEIAALTAALAGANARVQELESAPAQAPGADREVADAEISRLRGELANQMERAQAAEDRIATLEADVLAAARGVGALPVTSDEPREMPTRQMDEAHPTSVPPAPAGEDRYDDVWTAPSSRSTQTPEPPRSEPEPVSSNHEEAPEPAAASAPEPTSEPVSRDELDAGDQDQDQDDLSPDDMWSLRARLADAAAKKKLHPE